MRAELVAAYRRHRARTSRAWVVGIIGPLADAVRALAFTDPSRTRIVHSAEEGRRAAEDREHLLRDADVVAFVADTPGSWARLRPSAPDLTTSLDGMFEIASTGPERPWADVRAALVEASRADTRAVDLTGMLDGSSDQVHIDVASAFVDLYQPLVSKNGPDRWLFLAEAGAGKSTLLRWICQTSAQPYVGSRAPLYVSLAEYGQDSESAIRPLSAFLAASFERRGVAGASRLLANTSDIALLADGLDEIRTPSLRRQVVQELLSGTFGSVVLTGRTFVADDVPGGWNRILRARFDQRRRLELLDRFGRARGRTDGPALESQLRADPVLDRLVGTPLLAVFVSVLHEIEGRLPARRIELYDRIATLLVDRWTRVRRRGGLAPDRGQSLRVLGPLGWLIAEHGGAPIADNGLRPILLAIERRVDPVDADRRVEAQLGLLRTDTAVLTRTPWGWTFPHASIAQYFAAVEAARTPAAWSDLLADPFAVHRAEVVSLAAAYLDAVRGDDAHRDELVRAVLKKSSRPGRYGAVHPGVLGRLLVELEHLGPTLFGELAKRWCELALRAWFAPDTAAIVESAAVEVLDAMRHHPRAELFGSIVRTREPDWRRRSRERLEAAFLRWAPGLVT